MSDRHPVLIGSHRHAWTTGAVTTIAAATATAGHILSLRSATSGYAVRLRVLEIEFLLTTAFSSAQEVGYDAIIARSYTAAHTGATALTITGGRSLTQESASILTGRIANTGALTAGTHTLDTNAIAKGSVYSSAVGTSLYRLHDFTAMPLGGIMFGYQEGLVIRNSVLMGTSGVGQWHITAEWDDVAP